MKKLYSLCCCFMIFASTYAQLNLGDAVTTNSAANCTDVVVKIFNVGNPADPLAFPGNNWSQTYKTCCSTWTLGNLGPVFGLAINPNSGNPLIYVANTQIYYSGPACTSVHNFIPGNPYADNTVLIWQLTPATGAYIPLVYSTQTATLTSNASPLMYNMGAGIGNICYDKDHNRIFATNMEDGRIYCIDAISGNVLSRFDPFMPFTASATPPEFAKRGERIWGIAYKNNQLYFSQVNEDFGHKDLLLTNRVYSIGLDAMGNFLPATIITPFNYGLLTPTLVINNIPPVCADDTAYSNPIADIEISEDGKTMLLAERTMHDASPQAEVSPYNSMANNGNYLYYAHRSRVLRYNLVASIWNSSLPGQNYLVGNFSTNDSPPSTCVYNNNNCDGGVDFGYNPITAANTVCEGMVWATGDALKHPSGNLTIPPALVSPPFVYGITGINIAGNNAATVKTDSRYLDIFSSTGSTSANAAARKSLPGDVDVFRQPCCVLSDTVTVSADTLCVGDSLTISIRGGSWAVLIVNDTTRYEYFEIPAGGFNDVVSPNGSFVGNNKLCFVVYSANPDSTNDWCSDTTCFNLVVQNCGCDGLRGKAQLMDTVLNGVHYFYNGGLTEPTYIVWFVDGHEVLRTEGDNPYVDTSRGGIHTICMMAAYVLPGNNGHELCCYDEDCDTFYVSPCEIWKRNGIISDSIHPSDYHNVTFTYTNDSVPDGYYTTIVWDFGDENVIVNSGESVTHTYQDDPSGTGYEACAYVIWNLKGDSVVFDSLAVCCCVDTICTHVDIGPCYVNSFEMEVVDVLNHNANMQIVASPPVVYTNILWSIDGVVSPPVGSGSPFHSYLHPSATHHDLCAQVSYYINLPSGQVGTCTREVCTEIDWTLIEVPMGLMRFYPNPASNIVTVEVNAKEGDKATIDIIDFMGRPITVKEYGNLNQGLNYLYLNFSAYQKGLYTMKVTVNTNTQAAKVIKN